MLKQISLLIIMFLISFILFNCTGSVDKEPKKFIDNYSKEYQPIFYKASLAQWVANTNITDENTQKEITANKLLSEFEGRKGIIDSVKMYLRDRNKLDFETVGQLEKFFIMQAMPPLLFPRLLTCLLMQKLNKRRHSTAMSLN